MQQTAEPTQLIDWQKEVTVPYIKWKKLSLEDKTKFFPTGILHDIDKPEFCEEYENVCKRAKEIGKSEWIR